MEIEQATDEAVAPQDSPEPTETTTPAATRPTTGRWWAVGIAAMIVAIVGVLALSQLRMINALDDTRADIAALEAQVESVGESVDNLSDDVSEVAEEVAQAAAAAPSVSSSGSSPLTAPSNALPAGYLPRFNSEGPDQAIGMTLGVVEGLDAYTDKVALLDPSDGTKRVWMIWAHWCPFCQEELPELSGWYPGVEDQYSTELVTISTSISPERGNPLEPYLEEQQFPFPVLVDPESALAIQTGVSAFPFWIVTDGNGNVLLRATGRLHLDQVVSLFDQLETLES